MIKFSINKTNYLYKFDLKIVEINSLSTFEEYKQQVQTLINFFNEEYTWDNMFDIKESKERIKKGNNLFLLYFKNEAIGYVWFKELDSNICYGYNLYVTKKINRPKGAPDWFYYKTTEFMLKKYEKIEVDVEEWNTNVLNMITKIGYKKVS